MALLDPVVGHIGEVALAVVAVNVDPGKVADTEQIEIIIPVEIRERCTVCATVALGIESGVFCAIGEVALAVID